MVWSGLHEIVIPADETWLNGTLMWPQEARALVVFAHGSGSSRHSPRNHYVAGELNRAGIATLLMDLLTEDEEEEDYEHRFEIGLLSTRLIASTEWVMERSPAQSGAVGYFGASTGAASALRAAAALGGRIGAVVSRGGRPDLAGANALAQVSTPTLLIVGGLDTVVIELNEAAYALLKCEKHLAIVPGATHLFEEPGTLEEVARLATRWFERHLLGMAH